MSNTPSIHASPALMTPQISPKDIPQDLEGSETEEEPAVVLFVESSSSDEDDEGEVGQGYVPLSMDDGSEAPVGFMHESENDCTTIEEVDLVTSSGISSSSTVASASQGPTTQQMDNDQVDLIRQVMSNITLPSSAVPDWAKVIPEEKWKTSLVASMQNRTEPGTSDKDEPEK